jgi:hypothetical protein
MTMPPTIETEIAILKEQLKYIVENIDSIKENHLPHIYDRLNSIEKKLAYYLGGLAALTVIINVLLKFVK